MPTSLPIRRRKPVGSGQTGEDGYILIAVLFLVVMVLIALSVAAPKVAADIQRDREIELMHRGMQYRRAIQLYYRKFNAYPPNIEALEKTQNIRFLRKRYIDPATGKDEWKLIHFGQNKTPTAMGFFGQPLSGPGIGGSTLAGTGPGGVGQAIGTPIGGASPTSSGTDPSANTPTGSTPAPTTGTDPSAGNTSGAPTGTVGTSSLSTTGNPGNSIFASSTNGQTFGGGGIIGVESNSPKATILEYKKKKHFNEWEFTYDPISERMMVGGSNLGAIGQPAAGTGVLSPGSTNLPTGGQPLTPPGSTVPPPNQGTPPPQQ